MATDELLAELKRGSRRSLAKAITLVESSRPQDREQTRKLMACLGASTPPTLRLGVTGPPGVGKSTLIAALAQCIAGQGARPAVLSYDPASESGGSVLADKTRMQALLAHPEIYVRPSPTDAAGGGVGASAYQAALL
jgi:LAO/AO transport system kinase